MPRAKATSHAVFVWCCGFRVGVLDPLKNEHVLFISKEAEFWRITIRSSYLRHKLGSSAFSTMVQICMLVVSNLPYNLKSHKFGTERCRCS